MSKRIKKVESEELIWYTHSTRKSLFLDKKFIYEHLTYVVGDRSYELQEIKDVKASDFEFFEKVTTIEKNGKKLRTYIELVGAPLEFLTNNNYKIINVTN